MKTCKDWKDEISQEIEKECRDKGWNEKQIKQARFIVNHPIYSALVTLILHPIQFCQGVKKAINEIRKELEADEV